MSERWQRNLTGGLLVVALVAGVLVGITRAGDGDPWFNLPYFPGATHLGTVDLLTAGIAVDHDSRDADVLWVEVRIDEVAGYYAAGPEGWMLEHQTVLPDGQYFLYLTQGEQLVIVRVMSDRVYRASSIGGELDDPNGEADGAFVTIGLIRCLESGGVETCLGEVAGR